MANPAAAPSINDLLIKHGARRRRCPKCASDDIAFLEEAKKFKARCEKCGHTATASDPEKLILRWTFYVPTSTLNVAFLTSATGRDPWHPIKPEEVPEWVKHPDVIRRLLDGEEVQDVKTVTNWYRAVQLPTPH